jgi:hypothetical protein
LHHYFTPKRSIIKTESTIDKDSDLTMAQMFDGTAVRIPTEIIEENYQEVHIDDELEKAYFGIDLAKAYEEMKPIYKEVDDSFHNAEISALNSYEDMLKGNKE